jgi:hypothetical protein
MRGVVVVGQAGGGDEWRAQETEGIGHAAGKREAPAHKPPSPPGTWLSGGARPQLEVPLRGAPHQLPVQLTPPFFLCTHPARGATTGGTSPAVGLN